jgi:hypothetical protein
VVCYLSYGKYLHRWRLTAEKIFAKRFVFAVCSVPSLSEVFVCREQFPIFAEGRVVTGRFAGSLRQITYLSCACLSAHDTHLSARKLPFSRSEPHKDNIDSKIFCQSNSFPLSKCFKNVGIMESHQS